MAFRFADLPVRTKFLITLGIPVIGLVLLIGKQVDSSLKRRDVLGYVNTQAGNIRLFGDLADALQKESAMSVARLERIEDSSNKLMAVRLVTDSVLLKLDDPALHLPVGVRPVSDLDGLRALRERVLEGGIPAEEAERRYRRMNTRLLDQLGTVYKQAMDPETNDKLFAHLSLLSAKQALSDVHTRVVRAFAEGGMPNDQISELNDRIAQYETNTLLFQRDATSDVLAYYRSTFQGAPVNFVRSMIGTIHEQGSIDGLGISAGEWWELSSKAMAGLRAVEERSIDSIILASEANSTNAQQRLLIVLVALVGVVGAVGVMAFVIMRGISNTVNEVTSATSALAVGDIRARVPVSSNDEIGQMARSFNGMIENIRSLAASAEAIGKGNYDTPVTVRGERDVLGNALARMRENLKAARQRDLDQNTALKSEKEKLEQANERISVLIKEIHHRVKNNLQVIASLLRLQSSNIEDEHLLQVFAQSQSRVASMALIHEKLYKGDDLAQLDLAQYLEELFSELVQLLNVNEDIRYEAEIDPGLVLDLDTIVPLGLVMNELITNSFKHAFTGRDNGRIRLKVAQVGLRQFDLHYSDNGIGGPKERLTGANGTLGMSLIESLVEQLNGFFTVESDHRGTRYHIRFDSRK
ncbi:MAG TPA: histidine kinase dimerization/phosphoacceptor domain -containing protein [Flavobacteriales bacterium]